MFPPEFRDFFIASTGAGAALVGLLFVAVSIAPEQIVTRQAPVERQAVAGSAFTALTPAMASGLTDHLWSVSELLMYKVAPAPWVEPKRRGRPRRRPAADPTVPKRPRGRPRKVALSTFTS